MITAYLYVTLRCNAKCKFCTIWRERSGYTDMPLDLGRRLLNDLAKLGVRHVDFTGGEPTLYGPLPELLIHARKLHLFTSVTTNGTLYQKRANELSGLLDSLGFSLNGPNKDIHDHVQGIPCFENTISSLRLARSLNEPVHAHFTVSNDSAMYLEATLDMAKQLDIPLVIFPEFSYFGNEAASQNHLEVLKKLVHHSFACINQASLEFLRIGGNKITNPSCRAGRSAVAIAPDGSLLLPCFHKNQHTIPTNGDLYNTYKSDDVQQLLSRSGRYSFCEGCTNWCYINPSFVSKPNRLAFLHAISAIHSLRAIYRDKWQNKAIKVLMNNLIT